jgi:GNAT superfamily N-acetyltransferase
VTIDVRPVVASELAAAIAIMIVGSLSPEDERPDDLAPYEAALAATRREGGEFLVAVDGSEVVGVCQLIVFTHLQHGGGRCAELESVHVRADRRSEGIGALMLAEAERRAAAAGCYRIQLTSRVVRSDAHRFYLANGYDQSHLGFKKLIGSRSPL